MAAAAETAGGESNGSVSRASRGGDGEYGGWTARDLCTVVASSAPSWWSQQRSVQSPSMPFRGQWTVDWRTVSCCPLGTEQDRKSSAAPQQEARVRIERIERTERTERTKRIEHRIHSSAQCPARCSGCARSMTHAGGRRCCFFAQRRGAQPVLEGWRAGGMGGLMGRTDGRTDAGQQTHQVEEDKNTAGDEDTQRRPASPDVQRRERCIERRRRRRMVVTTIAAAGR